MGKKKGGYVIVFHLVCYCRHGLSYLISHSQVFAILSVTQLSTTFTSRPWIHGSTIIRVLVRQL